MVVVVGGGVGLPQAIMLTRRGAAITLVERGACGAEASWAAGGMLAPQAEADARDPFFELACASRDAYPKFADALLAETGIDIELDRTGTLYLAFDEADEREIARRHEWQRSAGLAVEFLTGDDARPALLRHVAYSPRGYLVPRRDGRLLAGSTSEHAGFTKAVTAAGLQTITTHALEIAPAVGALPLVDAWAGLRPHGATDWPTV